MGKIGKNAVENLTQSMYDDSRIIYREYIQNSSDQIDLAMANNSFPNEELEIVITIDDKKRNVFIRDNANGISRNEIVHKLEDIADSDKKQGEQKGFRGIGRLGGIGYCKELRFVTTYYGETEETIMIWNAQRLQEIFLDSNNHSSAEEVLAEVISYETRPVAQEDHYFEVQMLGINEANDELLDYDNIKQYISEVAPVNFKNTFIFKSKIDLFLKTHEDEIPKMHCYKVGIRKKGGEINYVHKDYPTKIYKMLGNHKVAVDDIRDIHTDIIRDDEGRAIAWIWYAISCFKGAINDLGNPWKGLRLRQFNIQIGSKTTLSKFFSETRGNSYFFGEVHTISKEYRPNARRDYFTETKEVKDFEYAIREYFKELSRLYKAGSEINSSFEKIKKLNDLKRDYTQKKTKGFISSETISKMDKEIKEAEVVAQAALTKLKKIKDKASSTNETALSQLLTAVENARNSNVSQIKLPTITTVETKDEPSKENKPKKQDKPKLLVDELTAYDKKTRKLIDKIYTIIQNNMIKEDAYALCTKIQEELKK